MDKNPPIFITRANQHIQEINRHFDGTLNNYGPMAFEENQEQTNNTQLSKFCCNQTLIIAIIKEVE